MRDDALGLFWEDLPKVSGKGSRGPKQRGAMPPIPHTNWTAPTAFPNLSGAKVIGLDTETYDPELTKAGPGWGRNKGHIIGASLSVADGSSWYFPMRHGWELVEGQWRQVLPDHEAAMNMDPDLVLRFLRDTLKDSRPKVGANLIYDIGWLSWEGVEVNGPLFDVQFAAALLNSETPSVALDDLGQQYLGVGKTTSILYDWLAKWCGGKANGRQRANLYLSPPSLAGPYAEDDASLPIRVLEKQWAEMHQRGVLELFDIECRLIPLLVKMRMKGAPIRIDKAEESHGLLGDRLKVIEEKIAHIAGQPVRPSAAASITSAFKRLEIPIPRKLDKQSGEMKVSYDKSRLAGVNHPLAKQILEWRKLTKVRDTFLKSYLMDKHVNGRVYTTFHPLKGEANGARSGRFSSSEPNLQNIPVRTEEGKLVRAAFGVDPAHGRWRSYDYSSIEYRLLVHYASGPGSDEVRAIFAANPTIDYHELVREMIMKATGIDLPRTKVKNVNFGIIYGMMLNALSALLGISKQEASLLLNNYHEAIPYAKVTMDACANEVHRTGVVRTILNRASDFGQWGPKGFQKQRPMPLPYELACRKWGMFNIERQQTHKALNRKLQGSAADVMKVAMVEAYEAGLFAEDACGIPVLTVHDELDFEDLGSPDNPAWIELKRTMEGALSGRLSVPLIVEGDVGETWADAH